MEMFRKKEMTGISMDKLEELLATINSNIVDTISIRLSNFCSSEMPFWADVKVEHKIYRVLLGDTDREYWKYSIRRFFDIIRESGIKFTCNEYKQQTRSGYKTWTV